MTICAESRRPPNPRRPAVPGYSQDWPGASASGLFLRLGLRYIGSMSDKPGPLYVVSIYDKPHWRTLLSTRNKAEAESLEQSMVADGVKARIETIEQHRR